MCDYTRNTLIFCYNKGMANNIVQLTDYNDNNIYPIAGAAAQGSITKSMLEEGVFEGPELSEPSTVAYVATDNIQDGAVTSDKIDYQTLSGSTVTLTSGYAFGTEPIAVKKGGIVFFNTAVQTPVISAVNNTTVAFTLPEGWRPVDTKNFLCLDYSGTAPEAIARVRVGSNGEVRFSKIDQNLSGQWVQTASICWLAG